MMRGRGVQRAKTNAGLGLGLLLLVGCRTPERSAANTPPAQPPEPRAEQEEATAKRRVPPPPTEPVDTPQARSAHIAVQQRLCDGVLPEHPLVHFTPVEDPSGVALSQFYEALHELEEEPEPGKKVRVAVYGSSSVAADRYTGYLRGYLQHRFGDGGIGFVSLVPLWRWHRHNEVDAGASRSWDIEHAQKERTGRLDGHYGLLGASAYTTSGRASVKVRGNRSALSDLKSCSAAELWYLQQPSGGKVAIELGGRRIATISTRGEQIAPGYFRPERPLERIFPIELRTRGEGEVRLFGAVLEREDAGVVVDTLGIGGTRAANMLDWTETIWADNLARRDPSLYVLAYGANEAVDEDEAIEVYRDNLDAVLGKFAEVVPDASCLLIGPVDFPYEDEESGAWIPRPRIDQIIEAQREVAQKRGCGFWDTRAFMGGENSMDAWVNAEPPLARSDHLHFNTLGYLHMGRVFADALMAGYDAAPSKQRSNKL